MEIGRNRAATCWKRDRFVVIKIVEFKIEVVQIAKFIYDTHVCKFTVRTAPFYQMGNHKQYFIEIRLN